MSSSRSYSLKDHLFHYTWVIFLVVLLAAAIHYIIYSRHLNEIQQDQQLQSLRHSAASIEHLLGFYQSVVDSLAKQHVVADLLQFGGDAEIQRWSNDMQRLLPESIGLALFDSAGRVKGDRAELRLSDRCFADMRRRIEGLHVPMPPVHYRIEHLAHFDIISAVVVDGENIGLVFASFSLNTINDLLQTMSDPGDAYQVVDADDYPVATLGTLQGSRYYSYQVSIPNTSWVIRKQTRDSTQSAFVASLLASNIVVFVLVIVVTFVAIKKLFDMVVSDFEALNIMMKKIKQGEFEVEKMPQPNLAETAGVIGFIKNAAVELHRYQKKLKVDSTTDELTGLYNRRVLNDRVADYLEGASAGKQNHVVILDLDHFKEINDNYGHELGDRVLVLFSRALKNNCKNTDICTRAGGDEFIVILGDYQQDDVGNWYARVCDDLQQSISGLCADQDIEIKFGVSAGCTSMRNNDNKHAILKRADEALYRVKTRGRNDIVCI